MLRNYNRESKLLDLRMKSETKELLEKIGDYEMVKKKLEDLYKKKNKDDKSKNKMF